MVTTVTALLFAALLPAASMDPEPRCRAELEGTHLTTTIAFPDGYAVEAPWVVVQTHEERVAGVAVLVADLSLDRIIEADGITGERLTTPLRQPILVSVEGSNRPEVVREAARTWCETVLETRGGTSTAAGRGRPLAGSVT